MRWIGPVIVATLALAGCANSDPGLRVASDTPSQSWLSYLSGRDISEQCHPGKPERFRLIHNALNGQHVHIFDVATDDKGARLEAHEYSMGELSHVPVADTFVPQRGMAGSMHLNQEETLGFIVRLADSGVFDPPAQSPESASQGRFYWLVCGCHEGSFFVSTFAYPKNLFQEAMANQAVSGVTSDK